MLIMEYDMNYTFPNFYSFFCCLNEFSDYVSSSCMTQESKKYSSFLLPVNKIYDKNAEVSASRLMEVLVS